MAIIPKKRCTVAGRPTMLGNLEDFLYNVIVDMRINKMKVTRNFHHEQASNLSIEHII